MAFIHDYDLNVDIIPTEDISDLLLSQNENGRNLVFRIYGVVIPDNSTAILTGTKPDGVVYSTTGVIDGNYIRIEEDVQLTAISGTWDAKLKIINGGKSVATQRIRITVDPDTVAEGSVPSESQLNGLVAEAASYAEEARSAAYGSPLTAEIASEMVDTARIYVYTGSETRYNFGHWYYWDGTQWADGGAYNSSAVQLDDTLSLTGVAADAGAVGNITQPVYADSDNDGNIVITMQRVGG